MSCLPAEFITTDRHLFSLSDQVKKGKGKDGIVHLIKGVSFRSKRVKSFALKVTSNSRSEVDVLRKVHKVAKKTNLIPKPLFFAKEQNTFVMPAYKGSFKDPFAFTLEEKIQMSKDFLDGMSLLLKSDILYLDFNLGNLMYNRQNRGRIIDFGRACDLSANPSEEQIQKALLAPPEILPFEEFLSLRVDNFSLKVKKIQLFALGLVLTTFLLEEGAPFHYIECSQFDNCPKLYLKSYTPCLKVEKGWSEDLGSYLKKDCDIPDNLAEIVMEMIEPDPEKRITVEEFQKKVEEFD
jgi:serine/threonine protein kinase